jgi:hypothetical protein
MQSLWIKLHSKLSAQIKARMRTKDEFQALHVAQQSGKALFKDLLLVLWMRLMC